jgi:hypothetical protein
MDSLVPNGCKIVNSKQIPTILIYNILGLASMGTKTIALDPTFGSFTLLKPISH